MIGIFAFLMIILALFIRAQRSLIKGSKLLERDADVKDSAIYYDRLAQEHNAQYRTICCGLWKVKKTRVLQDTSSDSSDHDKKHEYSVKYADLEQLLADFNRAQEVLNRQLIDRDKAGRRTVDDDGNLVEHLLPEEELLKEVQGLLQFVKQNKQVLISNLGDKVDDMLNDAEKINFELETDEIRKIDNPITKQVAIAMRGLVKRSNAQEEQYNQKLTDQTKKLQQLAYEKEASRNDELKSKLLKEYEDKLKNSKVTQEDREALLAELHAKLSHINDLAAEEQDHQNHNLNELLARRKAKREKLAKVLDNLGGKRIAEDDRYQNKLIEIKQKELDDKKLIDAEMDEIRQAGLQEIKTELQAKRLKSLSESERRMEDFKKQQGKGHTIESDLIFADMLADYGNKVKKLDADLADEKDQQTRSLEERIRDRRQARLREIEIQRKQKEGGLNEETVKTNSKLQTEIKQIESLLDPIKDEDERMKIILSKEEEPKALKTFRDEITKDDLKLSNQSE